MKYKPIITLGLFFCFLVGCQTKAPVDSGGGVNEEIHFPCQTQSEQTDYLFYKMSGNVRLGDVMPYYDPQAGKIYIYYLKNIWNDATNERHPWYGYTTTNFYEYKPIPAGEILGSSSDECKQDFALGTGSIVKKGSTYYAFYTGHNPNYPNGCVPTKEGVMLAKSTSLDQPFTKVSSFSTIYVPRGIGYDEQNNFRDPYVYYHEESDTYYMIVSARKDVEGTWQGVIAQYSSKDLISWEYKGILYHGGNDNFFMLETPQIFKMGNYYYLLFSDSDSRYVYYRKSTSIHGPWHKPDGYNRIVGNGIYAAKTVSNGNSRYIIGWTHANKNHANWGEPVWAGNMVVHKLHQKENGDLAVTIPPTLESFVEAVPYKIQKSSEFGNVTRLNSDTQSYQLVSGKGNSIATVVFEPVKAERYEVSATVSYSRSSKDFGFFVGACDGTNDFISLRFVPDQNVFRVDITPRNRIVTTTDPYNSVPFHLAPNTNYNIRIVIENSMVVIYIDDTVALSSKIYNAPGNYWGIFADNSSVTFSDITVTTP